VTEYQPHILTVTETTYRDIDDVEIEYDYALTCPGVTDHCRAFVDCVANDDEREFLEDADDPIAHGKKHIMIDALWMAATDDCLYVGHDNLPDEAARLGLPAGYHAVDVDYRGDGEINLIPLDAKVKP
jgi:hypothetical protein